MGFVAQTVTVSTQLEVLSAPAGLAIVEMASNAQVYRCSYNYVLTV